jgi:hypothetical protein
MTPLLDALTGVSDVSATFDHLDMSYRLRMRAFIGICMPPIFATMNSHFGMMALRAQGIAPIMFFLDFQGGPTPIAFGRKLTVEHRLQLFRSIADADHQPASEGTQRLLLVSESSIRARARTLGPEALGFDDGSGPLVEAGTARIMHVITRPVAGPADRQVTEVPPAMSALCEQLWQHPFPSVEGLGTPPAGLDLQRDTEQSSGVWGLPNTDINQHVNVQEYIMGAENQFSRLLHDAALPVDRHRIRRARLLFRKPFFPGQPYTVRAQLYRRGGETQMHAGFHLQSGTQPSPRPNAFAVYDGLIES